MLYSSSNGCFFYYDRVLYGWRIAEPTMLFLLGLEAVTSYENAQSDTLTLSKYAYYIKDSDIVPLEYYNEIHDAIYNFLSHNGSVEDFENYIHFNCYGLKLLLNEMTGTGNDRTVPIIFKSDINKSLINITTSTDMFRVSETDRLNMSQYDLQAQKIYDIFEDAGYSLSKAYGAINVTDINDYETKNAVAAYNLYLDNIHSEKSANSRTFYLLDYKAMYAYSLGVLYGCLCLGYKPQSVWRLRPDAWYNGDYFNLVNTAWTVFRFHHTDYIKSIDDDAIKSNKYKSIQENKIWNFDNESTDTFVSLEKDEKLLYRMAINPDKTTIDLEAVFYSQLKNTSGDESYDKGSYLNFVQYSTPQWKPVDEKISSTEPLAGLVYDKDNIITRYLAYVPIKIRRAHQYIHTSYEDKYLSPTEECNYFMITGSVGWVPFTENDFKYDLVRDENEDNYGQYKSSVHLSFMPREYNSSQIAMARDKENGEIISYYWAYTTKYEDSEEISTPYSHKIYGIFDNVAKVTDGIPEISSNSKFIKIISDDYFTLHYEDVGDIDGYIYAKYYDLDVVTYLYVDSTGTYLLDLDENDEPTEPLIAYFGYTINPSTSIDAYSGFDSTTHTPTAVDLRYIIVGQDAKKFWSSTWLSSEDDKHTFNPWRDTLDGADIYMKSDVVSLYRGLSQIADSIQFYSNELDSEPNYIFNDTSISYINDNFEEGFVPVKDISGNYNDLRDYGITTYRCQPVYEDDEGNSLLDENGNPLVWYDPYENLYWNGLFDANVWQQSKPGLFDSIMYNSLTGETKRVHDDFNNHSITIDGETISYTEFYSNPNYGIIRTQLQVFNPDKDSTRILTCYCDNTPEYERYIIPDENEMTEWVQRPDLLGVYGYWTVDGTETLYNGDISEPIVFDDEHSD